MAKAEDKPITRARAIECIEAAIKHHQKWSKSYFWEGGNGAKRARLQQLAEREDCYVLVRVYKGEAPISFDFRGWCNPSSRHVYYSASWKINDKIVTMRQAKTLLKRLQLAEAGTPKKQNKPTKGW